MCFDAARVFIKDLKDLDKVTARFSIDIKVLKDLKTHRDDGARGGQAPALREKSRPGGLSYRGIIKIGTARPPLHLTPHKNQKYHHEQDEVSKN